MTQPDTDGSAPVLVDAEADLLTDLRQHVRMTPAQPGWVHSSLPELLLARGRLFTPAPLPAGVPAGEQGRCYVESVSWAWASEGELAYVEGLGWSVAWPVEHAWCAGADGAAVDLTWPRPGAAYLGLPVLAEYAARTMGERAGPLLYGAVGMASELAVQWMRDGVPDDVLVDIGRAVPLA